jgi:hypothetical protein
MSAFYTGDAEAVSKQSLAGTSPAMSIASLCLRQPKRLALTPVACSPGDAAGSAAGAAATTATSARGAAAASAPSAPSTTPAAAAAATTPGNLLAEPGRSGVLFVEHVERRQADVGNLFLAKKDRVTRRAILRLGIRGGGLSRCRCSARHRQRHSGDSNHRDSFPPAPSLRSLFGLRHNPSPPCLRTTFDEWRTQIA